MPHLSRPKAKVGLVYDYNDLWAIELEPHHKDFSYYDLVYDAAANSAAGAWILITALVPDATTSVKGKVQLVDEDDMSSDSDTLVPTQQSVKAYVDSLATPVATATPSGPSRCGGRLAATDDSRSRGVVAGG